MRIAEMKKIAENINPDDYDYDRLGIRVVNPNCDGYDNAIGETAPESYIWEDGEQTDETLGGASAIDIRYLNGNHVHDMAYHGQRAWLIGGNDTFGGEDIGEIVIRDAVILEVFDI